MKQFHVKYVRMLYCTVCQMKRGLTISLAWMSVECDAKARIHLA